MSKPKNILEVMLNCKSVMLMSSSDAGIKAVKILHFDINMRNILVKMLMQLVAIIRLL
jgi:hypothetical protein